MDKSNLLDASLFSSSASQESRAQYSGQLLRCLLDRGYVRIINHGIPSDIIYTAFDWVWPTLSEICRVSLTCEQSRRFFDLPLASKRTISHIPGSNPQRGYSSLGSEKTSRVYAKLMGRDDPKSQRDARVQTFFARRTCGQTH